MRRLFPKVLFFAAIFACCVPAQAVDVDAAKKLARQNSCGKCHDPGKEAPFKKIAEKYRGDAQAEAKLTKHLTSNPTVTYKDGTKEEHKALRTTPADDAAQMKNLLQWVLAH
ncbi:MAG: cytochrome C [Azoarcus sp.]|jgi:cytochrome c|nr:cytochrome C [Azoarcus sp.]